MTYRELHAAGKRCAHCGGTRMRQTRRLVRWPGDRAATLALGYICLDCQCWKPTSLLATEDPPRPGPAGGTVAEFGRRVRPGELPR